MRLPWWLSGKNPTAKQETQVQFLGEANGNPLQYSCLENPTDGGAWWAAVHGVTKSQTRLSDFTFFLSLEVLAQAIKKKHIFKRQ